jgi:hypothetical protein
LHPSQLLPYEHLVKQAKLLFMHSVENHYAPLSFHNTWTKNSLTQGERPLRYADDCKLPTPRTELLKKSPLYTLPLEWNSMDDNKYIRNRTTFKTAVKYLLLAEVINNSGS